jgi:hypothetical protein
MSYTARFSECHEVLAHVPADSETAEVNTAWIYAGNHHRFAVLISVGDLAGAATFDVDLEQATDSSGTGVKAVTGKSITQLAATDDDVYIIIELQSEELDVANSFDYFRVEFTPATAAVEFAAFVLGVVPRFAPVSTANAEEVVT